MLDYSLLKEQLNLEAIKILYLIKEDYYNLMSEQKKKELDDLIKNNEIVVVNKGKSKSNNILAHGGRKLQDGKIHFYPDVRNFKTNDEMINKCKRILPHEIFHFFLQPDIIHFESNIEQEMASFYTEGLVEKETRKFCKNHSEIEYKKAYYGYNVNFVNMIQKSLGVNSYEILFSENDYLKDIRRYKEVYMNVLKDKESKIKAIKEISKEFPDSIRQKFYDRARKEILQDGNAKSVSEKLKLMGHISEKNIKLLEDNNKIER